MTENEDYEIADLISKISPYIRFIGVVGKTGELLSYYRREDLDPLLDQKKTQYQFAQIAIKTELEEQFDEQLGDTEFVWEERTKVQTIAFAISSKRIWITIDKNVIRSEMLRIIDSCLPIVKRYSSQLAKYLLVYCDESAEDFKVDGNSLPAFNQTESEFRSPRAYIRAQQSHYKGFYRYLIKEDVDKGWLATEMHKHEAFRDSIKAEKMLTVEAREERKEKQWERLEEFGSNLNVKNLVVLDPVIKVINIEEDDLDERLEGLEQERAYKESLPNWISEAGINAELLYTEHMNPSDLDSYNEFCQLEEWVYEARIYHQFGLMPVSIDIRERLPADTRYVCRIVGVVDKDDWDSYYFGLFDLKRGKIVYQRYETVGRNLSMGDLEKQTKTDLKIIAN